MSDRPHRTESIALQVSPPRTGRTAVLASCGVLIVLFGMFFGLCIGLEVLAHLLLNPVLATVSLISALTLGLPYLAIVLWLDRNEKEPPVLIASAFLWGGVMAVGVSGLFNDVFLMTALGVTGNEAVASQLTASFSAPFIEELSKGAAVVSLFLFFRRDFDNVLDGLVYGAVVGLGFGVVENFTYYARNEDIVGVIVGTYQRGLLMGLGTHAVFTGFTGAALGAFRVMRGGVLRWLVPPMGLALGMFTHFSWNTFTGLFIREGQSDVYILFVSYPTAVFVLQTPFIVLAAIVAFMALWHEGTVIRTFLATEEPEIVDEAELRTLVPAWRRNLHELSLLLTLQLGAWWRKRKRDRLLVRLAFEKWHMRAERMSESGWAQMHAVRVRELREKLRKS